MRCLEANKRPFWYALYRGKVDVLSDGMKTGEKVITYSDPVQVYGNISPASGVNVVEQFGNNENYDKVIILDPDTAPLIDEHTVLCVDKEPSYSDNVLVYDYVVKKVAKSLHHIAIAISKVAIS